MGEGGKLGNWGIGELRMINGRGQYLPLFRPAFWMPTKRTAELFCCPVNGAFLNPDEFVKIRLRGAGFAVDGEINN